MSLELRFMKENEWPVYKELFIKCFNEWDNNQFPQIVIFALEADIPVAFVTFTRIHVNTVHLQYLGTLPDKRSLNLWNILTDVFELIKDKHLKYAATRINALNKKALLASLHYGFIPRGFIAGYVELVKEI